MTTMLKLEEAVQKIESMRIAKDNMVILSPPDFIKSFLLQEIDYDLFFTKCSGIFSPTKYCGILVVEDESIKTVIVRSLISDHRVELED